MDDLLVIRGLTKRFPGVLALDDVSLTVKRGEVHGLLGENGAGKSTLIKMLSGAYHPDGGTILFEGRPVTIENPVASRQLGIVTIYQEFTLVPSLSIAENVFIGREHGRGGLIAWGEMRRQTRRLTDQLGVDLDPTTLVRDLSVAEQQLVEIARALSVQSRLIIMDEPTSALSEHEVQRLFGIIRDLKAQGISVIFVSHRLEEVKTICDRITVLRDGRNAGEADVADVTENDIIRMMVGRDIDDQYSHAPRGRGREVLRVTGLSRRGNVRDPSATVLEDISFAVYEGEILGIAGLVGAGRTELARAIFGADARNSGTIAIDGVPVEIRSPADAIHHGIGLVPEDRKQQGLFLVMAVRENLSMAALGALTGPGGFIRRGQERALVTEYPRKLNIRMASAEQRIVNLSGGNQQKVIIARWLAPKPRVLIVDEPTRGIDVGAKAEVHGLLHQLAEQGIAVIMISSGLPEILGMSDRILTMREGRITGEIQRADATEETLMRLMTLEQAG
jgi:inositol transport system ATP-binding protein